MVFLTTALLSLTCGCKHKDKHAAAKVDPQKLQVAKQKVDQAKADLPVMDFKHTDYDFGRIKEGDKMTTVFPFTNTGKSPLVISNAFGSCGCTIPEYPKHPIVPGAQGFITVTFNSSGKHGQQHKTVTLITNTANKKERLHISGNVIAEKS